MTEENLVHSEGPRVYKYAYLGDHNGNTRQLASGVPNETQVSNVFCLTGGAGDSLRSRHGTPRISGLRLQRAAQDVEGNCRPIRVAEPPFPDLSGCEGRQGQRRQLGDGTK